MDDQAPRIVVDNIWIRPDGLVGPALPTALSSSSHVPRWMLRAEGWAFVGRTHTVMDVEFDPRRIGFATLQGMLDAIRAVDANQVIRCVDVRYHNLDETVRFRSDSTLAACKRILRIYETTQCLEVARHALFQEKTRVVETTTLDVTAPETQAMLIPRMRAFLETWKLVSKLGPFIDRIDDESSHVSVFRLDAGDPRVCQLGGGLLFTLPNSEGARLADVIPAAQVQATRERLIGTILSGHPTLCRHRSETYDILSLSVPVETASGTVAISMCQRDSDASSRSQAHRIPPVVVAPADTQDGDRLLRLSNYNR